jgi:hypothetical protein
MIKPMVVRWTAFQHKHHPPARHCRLSGCSGPRSALLPSPGVTRRVALAGHGPDGSGSACVQSSIAVGASMGATGAKREVIGIAAKRAREACVLSRVAGGPKAATWGGEAKSHADAGPAELSKGKPNTS